MKKVLLCIAAGVAVMAHAQRFEVVSLTQVGTPSEKTFHPRFMPDGNLLVTAENYDGLGLLDVKSGKYTALTNMSGAGYYPVISEDGKTILTRSMDKQNFTQNIYSLDVATKALTVVAADIDHVNQIKLSNGKAMVAIEGKIVNKTVAASSITPVRKMNNDVLVTEEDLRIAVYRNGIRTVLDPLAGRLNGLEAQYTWTSLSPDGKKILFGCANYAYTCDLNGNNLVKLGYMRAPQWRGNNYVVGMLDADDGYFYTQSDIVIVSADGAQMQQLTPSSNEIKMYPSVSEDGSKIAYHTIDGKIYVMTIKEK